MSAFLRRVLGPCIFGHSRDYLSRRDANGVMRKECPRCHALCAVVLGADVVKDGPQARPAPVAGMPTGKATYEAPRKKVLGGKFQ